MIDQIHIEKVPAIFAYDIFPTKIVDQLAKKANVTDVETLSNNNLLGNDLLGNSGVNNHSHVGIMLENIKNMIIPLYGNRDTMKDTDP